MRVHVPGGFIRRTSAVDFSDLTTATQTGPARWEDDGHTLVIPFRPEPTTAEQRLIRRRLMTHDTEHEKWVASVAAELAGPPDATTTGRLVRLLATDAIRGIDEP